MCAAKKEKARIMVLHGPNLNMLGKRDPAWYGKLTLDEINSEVRKRAGDFGLDILAFQSNSEGALIDFIQANASSVSGILINPGALTHYGLALRDALQDTGKPVVEVHISNVYAREEWRSKSVIAPIARGQISGLGWRGYLYGIEALSEAQ